MKLNDLNELEKTFLDAYINQISSKSVERFERSRKCVKRNLLNKIVNICHSNPI